MRTRHALAALTLLLAARPGLAEEAPLPPVTQPEPPLVAKLDGAPDFLLATADGGFVFATEKKFGRWGKDKAAWEAKRSKEDDDLAGRFTEISCDAKGDRVLAFSPSHLAVFDGKTGKPLVDKTRSNEKQVEYEHATMTASGEVLLIERTDRFAACAVVKDAQLRKELRRTKVDPELDHWSLSPDGKRLNYIASIEKGDARKQTVCVREFGVEKDVLLLGKHLVKTKDGERFFTIGPSSFNGILHDGQRYLLLSKNGGCWSGGTVLLYDWKKKDPVVIAGNAMAADFAHGRFAVVDHRNRLAVYDMTGKAVHEVERLPGERTDHLSFAPDGKSLLVGDAKGEVRRVTLPK